MKTDKRDARRLAGLHAAGLLTEIFIPTPKHEALRDLVRAREDARLDRMRARHRLGKFCLRHEAAQRADRPAAHARRLLVESAWNVRRRPTVGYELSRRQRGGCPLFCV